MVIIIEPTLKKISISVFNSADKNFRSKNIDIKYIECQNSSQLQTLISSLVNGKNVKAISVRILFGGNEFRKTVLLNDDFFKKSKKLLPLRSHYILRLREFLHILGEAFSNTPIILFFDTAFFADLPASETCYAIPEEYFGQISLKKWGFHGIWHKYNGEIPKNKDKTISIVLDKHTTVCGIRNNKPVVSSIGITPLEGIMGKTSSGDIDPGIVFYLMKQHDLSIFQLDKILKKNSGFKGLTNYDMDPDKLINYCGTDEKIDLAFQIYLNQLKKYIGESMAILQGVTNVVISGDYLNAFNPLIFKILKELSCFDIQLKELPWESKKRDMVISSDESVIQVYLNRLKLSEVLFLLTRDYLSDNFVSKKCCY